jgi:DHA2 family multidrug resistance protein
MLFTAPIAGLIARKTDPRGVLIVGFLLMALSTWMTHNITADWRFDELLWPQIVRGMGLMSCMVTISMTSFATLPAERLKDASGLFTLMRNLGGAMGLAMINTVVLWRFNLHWGRLAESINPGRPEVAERIDLLTGLASNRGLANPEMVAVRQIGNQVYQQALVMSYADCFTLLSLAFVSVALLPLLLKRPQLLRNDPEA